MATSAAASSLLRLIVRENCTLLPRALPVSLPVPVTDALHARRARQTQHAVALRRCRGPPVLPGGGAQRHSLPYGPVALFPRRPRSLRACARVRLGPHRLLRAAPRVP